MNGIPLWLAIGLAVGFTIGFLAASWFYLQARKVSAGLRNEVRDWAFRANEAVEIAENLKEIIEPLRLAVEAERRKSAGYLETIESVIRQREVWENLYNKQAVEHGNAQALMMDAVNYLTGRLRQAGIEVKIPPLLQEVQGLYQDGHVFPVTERLREPIPQPIEKGSGRALDAAAAQAVGQRSVSDPPDPAASALLTAVQGNKEA